MTTLAELRSRLNDKIQDRTYWESKTNELTQQLADCDVRVDIQHHALDTIVGCAMMVQESIQKHVAKLVSECLEYVFDEPYEFKILFEEKRNTTEARLVFLKGDDEVDPMTASGGGVVDVAAFGLRLACLLLTTPSVRKLMIMDEPFRFLSVQYRDRVRALIEQLSEDYDCQFVIVTHMDELRIGKVVDLS